jgi:DNA-binding MarR family transcriptional regulator
VTEEPFWEPADDLPHRLTQELFDLGSAIDLVGRATAAVLGINQTDLICLQLLAQRGPLGASELAQAMGLTTAAVSAMASRLEAGGYARREMDPNDRRRVSLHISRAGAVHAFSLFDGFYSATSGLLGELREREQKLLLKVLGRFRELISEQTAELRAQAAQKRPKTIHHSHSRPVTGDKQD